MATMSDGRKLVRASVATGEFLPALVTVPDVEILEVGEDWETSTGLFTWDEEDLLSAISSQDDPAVRTPILKLGHVDERQGFDGQPAFGRLVNLRVTNNDQTLVCDLAGVPKWLADVMPTAYPRRSIEGWFECKTRTGNDWPFVLTGLALLGSAYPAINTLEDLPILWGSEMPPMTELDEENEDTEVAAEMPGGLIRARKVVTVPTWLAQRNAAEAAAADEGKVVSAAAGKRGNSGQAKATTSVSDVTSAYYDSLGSSQMWWWIRQVLVNPFQLVVDDDEGHLYLIDVAVDASDTITFGEPQEVKVEYVAAVAANLAEVRKSGQIVAASHGDRVSAGAPEKPAEGEDSITPGDADETQREHDVQLTDDALRALGLEPGATEEQINAAILARAQGEGGEGGEGGGDGTQTTEPGGGTPDTTGQPSTPATDPAAQPTTEPAPETSPGTTEQSTLTLPPGTVLVDQAQWQEVQQEVAASKQSREQTRVAARDAFLAEACKQGKFPRARIAHYTTMWEADPTGTKTLVDTLPPGLVPVTERGGAGETDPKVEASAYPDSWKSDRQVAAARNSVSSRVKVVND